MNASHQLLARSDIPITNVASAGDATASPVATLVAADIVGQLHPPTVQAVLQGFQKCFVYFHRNSLLEEIDRQQQA